MKQAMVLCFRDDYVYPAKNRRDCITLCEMDAQTAKKSHTEPVSRPTDVEEVRASLSPAGFMRRDRENGIIVTFT